MMKKFILILVCICLQIAHAETFTGGVSKLDVGSGHQIVDSATNMPIQNAKVSLPYYSTRTDGNGNFNLPKIDAITILSVEKDGYRPFSLTVNDSSKALVIGIEKSHATDIVIDSNIMHLGDNNFSPASANAGDFRLKSAGPYYTKQFVMKAPTLRAQNYLIIGSIVGIDTLMARSMGQNRIVNSYATAPEVYFNGAKIAEIQLNGDNQRIKLPNNLIKADRPNEVTIKTGRNQMQRAYVDYDDIEIANLSILSE